jgi:DNA-binding CsgD family transcriptional regulator
VRRDETDLRSRIDPELRLSRRKVDVLRALARSADSKAAARELGISVNTFNAYMYELKHVFKASGRVDLVLRAVRHGFIEEELES